MSANPRPRNLRPPRPCRAWVLVEPTGTIAMWAGTAETKRDMIERACEWGDDELPTYPEWREMHARGYRVVRVRIVPEVGRKAKPPKPRS